MLVCFQFHQEFPKEFLCLNKNVTPHDRVILFMDLFVSVILSLQGFIRIVSIIPYA